MNVLILGGNRFIGKKLAEKLNLNGVDVTVLNRKGTGPNGCTYLKFDRNYELDIKNEFDLIIDFCLFKPNQAELIKKFVKYNQKYIFISSGAAYKDNNNLMYTEEMNIGGLSFFGNYGVEKAQCEKIVSTLDNYLILRPAYIDGPSSHRFRILYYLNCILNNQEVEVNNEGNKLFSFTMERDIVNELYNMSVNFQSYKNNTSYNIVNEEVYTECSLINEISSFYNIPSKIKKFGKSSPFCNEKSGQIKMDNFILSPLKLGKKFSTVKDNLPYFYEKINENKTIYS